MSTTLSAAPDRGLASKQRAIDWLYEKVTHNWRVCENCYGDRTIEDIHRVWGGATSELEDLFCTCGSGSGQPHAADVSGPSLRGGEGTVGRQWSDGSLPVRDASGLSEMQLVRNIATHLEGTLGYDIREDVDAVLDALAERSAKYPTRNVQTLKWGAWLLLTDDAREQVRRETARNH